MPIAIRCGLTKEKLKLKLTKEQLDHVDKLIKETTTQTDWNRDDDDNEIEVDDVESTLSVAAERVGNYLSKLEVV